MAKRLRKKAIQEKASPLKFAQKSPSHRSPWKRLVTQAWLPLLLATITFLVYWPSLWSDFVYDGRREILEEGFITNIANLPAVLTLKVLGMNLMLGPRPGSMLYLMLIAAICGKEPFGYHLCSNLLHAANVVLLFVLLSRLVKAEVGNLTENLNRRVQLAIAVVTMAFAVHPLTVEPVSAINYCSDLLVAFFTLTTLLLATAFKPKNTRMAWLMGGAGVLCAFAAVTCKESGVAAAGLLIVYWFLFRRSEAGNPWLWLLGSATGVTVAFLAARFMFAPASSYSTPTYLGGSFLQVFLIQPRLWVFMMGKLAWPAELSADYTVENLEGLSLPIALMILAIAISLQVWLTMKSRIGALGVAIYWLGLITVSNFIPIFRIMSDRFYYFPLIGIAFQLLALCLLALKSRDGYWAIITPCFFILAPLITLTISREDIFSNESSLWSDTVQTSPFSSTAHNHVGAVFFRNGQYDAAVAQYQIALEIEPRFSEAHNNLGLVFFHRSQLDKAIAQYQAALEINPDLFDAHNNLGVALLQKGRIDKAILEFQEALRLKPDQVLANYDLGVAFLQQGQIDKAIPKFLNALELDPNYADAHCDLGLAFFAKGRVDEAIAQYQQALQINPNFSQAHHNLGLALAVKGHLNEAIVEYKMALEINPQFVLAHNNLGLVFAKIGQVEAAKAEFRKALQLEPNYLDAQKNLANVETISQRAPSIK